MLAFFCVWDGELYFIFFALYYNMRASVVPSMLHWLVCIHFLNVLNTTFVHSNFPILGKIDLVDLSKPSS